MTFIFSYAEIKDVVLFSTLFSCPVSPCYWLTPVNPEPIKYHGKSVQSNSLSLGFRGLVCGVTSQLVVSLRRRRHAAGRYAYGVDPPAAGLVVSLLVNVAGDVFIEEKRSLFY